MPWLNGVLNWKSERDEKRLCGERDTESEKDGEASVVESQRIVSIESEIALRE